MDPGAVKFLRFRCSEKPVSTKPDPEKVVGREQNLTNSRGSGRCVSKPSAKSDCCLVGGAKRILLVDVQKAEGLLKTLDQPRCDSLSTTFYWSIIDLSRSPQSPKSIPQSYGPSGRMRSTPNFPAEHFSAIT